MGNELIENLDYYYDTEFLEGKFGTNGAPTIELISIGIVSARHGKAHYYAVSREFDTMEAWFRNDGTIDNPAYWIRENVLRPLFEDLCLLQMQYEYRQYDQFTEEFNRDNFIWLLETHGKTIHQIKTEIIAYLNPQSHDPIKLFGYYSAYDHVVFCWLFGKMIDLPSGMPMYTIDLKQELDRVANVFLEKTIKAPIVSSDWHPKYALNHLKDEHAVPYPIQSENEHNALADAKWNKELHDYIKTVDNFLKSFGV